MTATYSDVTEGNKDKIFKDPTLVNLTPKQEDPAVVFLRSYWKPFLIVLAVVGAVWYGKISFDSSRQLTLEGASESFDTFRGDIATYSEIKDELVKPDLSAEKRSDLEKREKQLKGKVEEEARAFASVKEPYKSLAMIYQAGFFIKSGDLQKGKIVLDEIVNENGVADAWKLSTGAQILKTPDKILKEGAIFKLANLLVDQGQKEGTILLKEVATSGKFFAITAGVALANLADTPEKKGDALVVLLGLKEKFPEQEKVIEPEINRLTVSN